MKKEPPEGRNENREQCGQLAGRRYDDRRPPVLMRVPTTAIAASDAPRAKAFQGSSSYVSALPICAASTRTPVAAWTRATLRSTASISALLRHICGGGDIA